MLPLKDRAREGRANPIGIPVAYAASDEDTALSEVRPAPGEYVSLVTLVTTRVLRMVNCAVDHDKTPLSYLYAGRGSSPDEMVQGVWSSIDEAFARPVSRSDDVAEYSATQIIAELFRDQGVEGIVYKSRMSDAGYNWALFDPTAVHIIKGSQSVFRTGRIRCEFDGVAL
ncbi:MAG: RES domain-containing protein [Alphaproteobacteria bacterium]|nr:RES domain-containing protein [Alphaproteobacteria bacterium]